MLIWSLAMLIWPLAMLIWPLAYLLELRYNKRVGDMAFIAGQRKRSWTPPPPYTLIGKELTKVKASLSEDTGKIVIIFPPNSVGLSDILKRIGTAREIGKDVWEADFSFRTLHILFTNGCSLDPRLFRMYLHLLKKSLKYMKDTELNRPAIEEKLKELKQPLFPFQVEGVMWLESRKGRALLADEMGLGKTVQALAWLYLHPTLRPAIIICPASAKFTWINEVSHFLPSSDESEVGILSGKKAEHTDALTKPIIVVNYDILESWAPQLKTCMPQVIILDEVHYIKSSSAKRTKIVKNLAKDVPCIIGLSGTPIVNRPIEVYGILKLLLPDYVPLFWPYVHRYCAAKYTMFGWNFTGAGSTEELHTWLINTVMLRRKKDEVLTQLPSKLFSVLPQEINNKADYSEAENNFLDWLAEKKGNDAIAKVTTAQALVQMEVLKQLAAKGKMAAVTEWIDDFLISGGQQKKLVVFAVHKDIINLLMAKYKKIAVKIDGSVSISEREKAVNEFQNNPKILLFIGNVKAAGVAITLTAADSVLFAELPWTPGDLSQATDRVHRIGQKNTVNVYYAIAQNTIEEKLMQILADKQRVLESVLDGKGESEESVLGELLNEYLKKLSEKATR